MKFVDVVREKFSRAFTHVPHDITRLQVHDTKSPSEIPESVAKYLIELYDWDGKCSQDLYEHLLIHEPEVAAYVTKMSEMVGAAYQYFSLIDSAEFDNTEEYENEDGEIESNENAERKLLDSMKDTSNDISRTSNIKINCFQTWSALVFAQGETFIEVNKNLSMSIIPNNRVTILDDIQYKGQATPLNHLITEENYLIINEGLANERVLEKGQFIHIKLNDVPINLKDSWGRYTFGIYAISPLQRCLSSIWLKGQTLITEAIWRYNNLPKEHHTLAAEAFSPEQYKGIVGKDKIIEYANGQMASAISRHANAVSKKNPDQHYITSSNIGIKPVEHSSSSYMDSNNLLVQIQNMIWDGLCTPQSVIRGASNGSYASELIISSGVSLRIEQIAKKIGDVVLDNMKQRLLEINPQFPVRYLNIKIGFELNGSQLEKHQILAIKKQAGLFTPTECRETVGSPALTKDQINEEGLVTADGIIVGEENLFKDPKKEQEEMLESQSEMEEPEDETIPGQNIDKKGIRSDGTISYPTTPQSKKQQPTGVGKAIYKDATDKENYMK